MRNPFLGLTYYQLLDEDLLDDLFREEVSETPEYWKETDWTDYPELIDIYNEFVQEAKLIEHSWVDDDEAIAVDDELWMSDYLARRNEWED